MSTQTNSIAAVILTFNEEENIRYCLESVKWANEIIIVDSGSTDRTIQIVREYTDRIYEHEFQNFAQQRNWVLESIPMKSEWVFFVDADEQVPPQLRDEIIERTLHEPEIVGYYVKLRYIFLGRWLKHGGKYPVIVMRLFKRKLGIHENRAVSPHVLIEGETAYLKNDMMHQDHKLLDAFITKHNRYSRMNAEEFYKLKQGVLQSGIKASFWGTQIERRRAIKEKLWLKLPFKPIILFIYMYFIRLGFLDGKPGFIYCCLMAIQAFHTSIKLYELEMLESKKVSGDS